MTPYLAEYLSYYEPRNYLRSMNAIALNVPTAKTKKYGEAAFS